MDDWHNSARNSPRDRRYPNAQREEFSIPRAESQQVPPKIDRRSQGQGFTLPEGAHRTSSGSNALSWLPRGDAGKWTFAIIVVLALVSALLLVDAVRGSSDPDSSASGTQSGQDASAPGSDEGSGGSDGGEPGPIPDGKLDGLEVGTLPPGGPVTEEPSGEYRTIGKPGPRVGDGGKLFTYTVEVEDTIDSAAFGGDDAFAAMVDSTLANPKGWTGEQKFSFQHVDAAELPEGQKPDLHIQLTSQKLTHEVCGNEFKLETSCFWSDGNRVIINESRWIRGAIPFEGDLGGYRQYLLNHEIGHGIGFASHQPCPGDGSLAPVMMQQTLSLDNRVLREISNEDIYGEQDAVCKPNPWPYPIKEK